MKINNFSLLFVLFLLVLPLVNAEVNVEPLTFKQYGQGNIEIPLFENDLDECTICTAVITISDPNGTALTRREAMNVIDNFAIFTVSGKYTSSLGTYIYVVSATNGVNDGAWRGTYLVTPSGRSGLLGFFILIIALAYGVVLFGSWKSDVTITMLGTFSIFLLGLYVLFYGLDIYKNYLTDGFAIITLGIASYLGVIIGNEYIDM